MINFFLTARLPAVFLAFGLVGCASEQALWETTRQKDTVAAYSEYLSKSREHGWQSGNATAARSRISELRFAETRQKDTPAAYQEYLRLEPRGQHAEEARTRLIQLANAAAAQKAELAARKADDEAYAPFAARQGLDTAIAYLRAMPTGSRLSEVSQWLGNQSDVAVVPGLQLVVSLGRARSLGPVNASTGQMNWMAQGFEHVTREVRAKPGNRLVMIGVYFGSLGSPKKIGASSVSIISNAGVTYPCIGWLMAWQQVRSEGTFEVTGLTVLPAVFEIPVGRLDALHIAIDGKRTMSLKDLKIE